MMNNENSFVPLVESQFVNAFNELNPIKDLCPTIMFDKPIGEYLYMDYIYNKKPVDEMAELTLVRKSHIIETKNFNIDIEYSRDIQNSMKPLGIDFNAEMFKQMVSEFGNKITSQFYDNVKSHAITHYEKSLKWYHKVIKYFFKNYIKRVKINDVNDLVKLIARNSNKIFHDTRIGSANFILTTPKIASYLADSTNYKYSTHNEDPFNQIQLNGTIQIGTEIPIYVYPMHDIEDDYIIVGRIGKEKEIGIKLAMYDTVKCVPNISSDLMNNKYTVLSKANVSDVGEKHSIDNMFRLEYIK